MMSHESKSRLCVALVEPEEESALQLCNWIAGYGYEPMWVRTVEDLRIQWSILLVDAVVLGPSFHPFCPPCRQLEAVCPEVPVLLAPHRLTDRVGPAFQTCRRETCAVLNEVSLPCQGTADCGKSV